MRKKLKLLLIILIPIICLVIAGIPFTLADYPETPIEQTMTGTSAEDTGASTADKSMKGGALYISGGASYTMTGGSITGKTNQYGGAVYVTNGSTFTMTGGTITGCTALYGGAIYVEAGGTCNITGGTITGNRAQFAPAIYVEDGGVLNVDQTAVIKDNEYELYGNLLEVYVDGSLVQSRYIKADTYTIDEDEMPLDYEHCCGYFLDEKLSQCSFGEIALTSESMGFAPRTADAEDYVARLYTRTANPNNFTFTFNSTTQTYDIKAKSTSISGHIVLPKEYENVQTSIYSGPYSAGAFYGCSVSGVTFQEGVTQIPQSTFYNNASLSGDLIIPNSVISIGQYAFSSCSGLNGKLLIGNGVQNIENYAFYGCSKLTGGLIIPDSVATLGDSAFRECTGFNEDLILGKNLTSISANVFYNCESLTGNLVLPSTLTSVGNYAFYRCMGLTGKLVIPSNIKSIGTYAFAYCSGFNGTLTFENGVETIGQSAFDYCRGFNGDLYLPTSIVSIGRNAFWECSGFTGDLTIESGAVGNYSFYNCVGFSGSLTIGDGVTSIGVSAFKNCSMLNGCLVVPGSVSIIGESAFEFCKGFTSIEIKNGVTAIDANCFYACQKLAGDLVIPSSVKTVGSAAFSACSLLNTITIEEGVESLGIGAFYGLTKIKEIKIPASVKSIGGALFSFAHVLEKIEVATNNPYYDSRNNCNAIINTDTGELLQGCQTTIIPDNVTSIGQLAFYGIYNLNKIFIPSSVSVISVSAANKAPFYSCLSNLVIYTDVPNAESIPSGWGTYWNYYDNSNQLQVVYGCSLDSEGNIVLPTNDINIYADGATTPTKTLSFDLSVTSYTMVESDMPLEYENCCGYFLDEILITTIKNDVVDLSNGDVNLYTRTADPSLFSFTTDGADGYIITKNSSVSYSGTEFNLVMPREYDGKTVTAIAESAFAVSLHSCTLSNIVFSSELTAIPDYCFDTHDGNANCNIGSINIHNNITSIGESVFAYCDGFTEGLIIGNGVKTIGDSAFTYCWYMTGNLILPDSLISIGDYAFTSCQGLTSLKIGNNVTNIGEGAFLNCRGLSGSIIIPNSVTSIGERAFGGCTGLEKIFIPSSATTISAPDYYSAPFLDCSSSLVIYTDVANAESVPSGWNTYWNYYSSSGTLTVNYGYTLEQYKSAVGLTFAPNGEEISSVEVETIENVNDYQVDDSYLQDVMLNKNEYVAILKENEKIA